MTISLRRSSESADSSDVQKSRKIFSSVEDEQLIGLVHQFGVKDWEIIAGHMTDRTPRQCRDRWKIYLCPSVNRAPWTPDEDRLLFDKVRRLGRKSASLCPYFENRTPSNVKNRWNSVMRKLRALKLDERSEKDFLYCARLITRATAGMCPLISEDEPAQPVFSWDNLLNHYPEQRGLRHVCGRPEDVVRAE
jgi:hypothetical protein